MKKKWGNQWRFFCIACKKRDSGEAMKRVQKLQNSVGQFCYRHRHLDAQIQNVQSSAKELNQWFEEIEKKRKIRSGNSGNQ